MEEKYITSSRGKTYYYISKKENYRCLFFVHGISGDHTLFQPQLEYFQKNYTVITLDIPLHGNSRPYQDFSFAHVAAEINAILEIEGVEKAVFFGQSLGGFPVQAFYNEFPEQAEALVFVDSSPFGDCYTTKTDRFWLRHIEGLARLCPYKYWLSAGPKSASVTEAAQNMFRTALSRYTKDELCKMFGICYRAYLDYHDPVPLHCPTLLLVGMNDTTGKVKVYNELWHKKEGYPLIFISNAAHCSNLDNAAEFNDIVEKFLATM